MTDGPHGDRGGPPRDADEAPLRDLDRILSELSVRRRPGVFVVCAVDELPTGDVEALVVEDEGVTVVVTRETARRRGLTWEFEAAWLTIEVHTALDGVGLTAAFSRALAAADIPCNVLAGYHHDHVLVPTASAEDALATLRALRR